MAPPKKPPKNAFSFYMDEFIPDLKKKGVKINHKREFLAWLRHNDDNLEEAVPYLLAEWKALPKEEKHPYE